MSLSTDHFINQLESPECATKLRICRADLLGKPQLVSSYLSNYVVKMRLLDLVCFFGKNKKIKLNFKFQILVKLNFKLFTMKSAFKQIKEHKTLNNVTKI